MTQEQSQASPQRRLNSALDDQALLTALNKALEDSRKAFDPESMTPQRASSLFCTHVALKLTPKMAFVVPVERRHIHTPDGTDPRKSGEWLLDIAWTEDCRPDPELGTETKIPRRLLGALECESSTSGREFFMDLAKLVVVRSPLKIFLAGLDQRTAKGCDDYIQRRLAQVHAYLTDAEEGTHTPHWLCGFWPSPTGKRTTCESLWLEVAEKTQLAHLRNVRLYRWNPDVGFREVPSQSCP
jgi:hypothetical protein